MRKVISDLIKKLDRENGPNFYLSIEAVVKDRRAHNGLDWMYFRSIYRANPEVDISDHPCFHSNEPILISIHRAVRCKSPDV